MLEEEPKPLAERPLDRYSEDELEARIKTLKAEIAACEAELERKRSHRSAADALFGDG
ncbi:MAG: DUF1192 domain-containing protein [Pseudomonadota bacterium]